MGLWSVAVGFGELRLVEAARQMAKLPYCPFVRRQSHPQAIALAEMLVKIARGRLAKAQFTSFGSEANDFVVKLVWYYKDALDRPKKEDQRQPPERQSRHVGRLGLADRPAELPSRLRPAAANASNSCISRSQKSSSVSPGRAPRQKCGAIAPALWFRKQLTTLSHRG